jgi:hypothetical protein
MGPRTRIIALLPYCLTASPTAIQVSGVGCQVPGTRYLVPNRRRGPENAPTGFASCILHTPCAGFSKHETGIPPGARYRVPGIGYRLSGTWDLVPGTWNPVPVWMRTQSQGRMPNMKKLIGWTAVGSAVPESGEFSSPDPFLLHRPMTRRPAFADRSAARGVSTGVPSRGTPGRAFRATHARGGQPIFVSSALYPGTGLVFAGPEMP